MGQGKVSYFPTQVRCETAREKFLSKLLLGGPRPSRPWGGRDGGDQGGPDPHASPRHHNQTLHYVVSDSASLLEKIHPI